MDQPQTTSTYQPICPLCEAATLQPAGQNSARCSSCGCLLHGDILETLRQIDNLPDVFGDHACECGHPEMRRLPDGVFRCPACGSEVLPITPSLEYWKQIGHSEAYWCGWTDGRFGEIADFTHNAQLAAWDSASDRLDYYQGHRSGRADRQARESKALKHRLDA
ncbi:hypothetical protein BH24ACT20_BH24ACT20_09100 [soil metagenome]